MNLLQAPFNAAALVKHPENTVRMPHSRDLPHITPLPCEDG
ncbi:hypothetical protein BN134_68 [Cronobacter dublinensis 1210]|uniref:Uncharacterized protein n=1 Tax=Cronobacter dublinensis 1210 TaxID=1208656 RepID=A0ABP1W2U5_9ENTR|nr:hypothetical protein BN134_68 [Cronobacter dublinensis 1210]